MRHILAAMVAMLPCLAWSQAGTTVEEFKRRIGGTEERQSELYNKYALMGNYYWQGVNGDSTTMQRELAYPLWKELMLECPQISLELYTQGADMLGYLLGQGQDTRMCQVLFDDFMWLYDVRQENLPVLNSYQRDPLKKATRGDMMVWKAYQNALYGEKFNPNYSLEDAYTLFSDALKEVRTNGGREVSTSALEQYMIVSYKLYNKNQDKYFEQFLDDYLLSTEVCYQRMATANEMLGDGDKSSISDSLRNACINVVSQYSNTALFIEGLYGDAGLSGEAGKEQMNAVFMYTVDEHADDVSYLRRVLKLMRENGCTEKAAYYKAGDMAYNLKPDFESALALAFKSFAAFDYVVGSSYADEALDECDDKTLKGKIALIIANKFSRRGRDEIKTARNNAGKKGADALMDSGKAKLTRSLDYVARAEAAMGHTGLFYYQAGFIYYYASEFQKAVDAFTRAVEVDMTYKSRVENPRAAAEEALARQMEIEQRNKANAAQYAAYQAYLKKKKEEDDFWNGRK